MCVGFRGSERTKKKTKCHMMCQKNAVVMKRTFINVSSKVSYKVRTFQMFRTMHRHITDCNLQYKEIAHTNTYVAFVFHLNKNKSGQLEKFQVLFAMHPMSFIP